MHWISRFNLEHGQASKINLYTIHLLVENRMVRSLLKMMENNGANHFHSTMLKISKLKQVIFKVTKGRGLDYFKM